MNDITQMLVQRLSLGLLTLFVVSLIIFLGVSLLPNVIGNHPIHDRHLYFFR